MGELVASHSARARSCSPEQLSRTERQRCTSAAQSGSRLRCTSPRRRPHCRAALRAGIHEDAIHQRAPSLSYVQPFHDPRARSDELVLLEVLDDDLDARLDVDLRRLDVQLGRLGRLVRRRDASELCERGVRASVMPSLEVKRRRRREERTLPSSANERESDAPLMTPARALAYRPLGSRFSTSASGASTNTSRNGILLSS